MKHENVSISDHSPEQIWNQLEYETKQNPIEKFFPMDYVTGRWEGNVPGGDEDFTEATVYPIEDSTKSIRNLLLVKFETDAPNPHEFAYLPTEETEGCFVRFGSGSKIMLVTSDLLTAVALANNTSCSAHFSLYPENTEDVAISLAKAFPSARVVICEDEQTDCEKLPKNVYQLTPPAKGFYNKVLANPEQVKKKIDDCILSKKNEVIEDIASDTTPKKNGMNGTTLIRSVSTLILACSSISEGSALIIALYVFFTYLTDKVQHAPLLGLCSPARRCGKTVLLKLLTGLVKDPFYVKIVTKSALEICTNNSKTPLLDELDTFIKENPGLIGLINGGVEDTAGNAHTGKQGQVVFRKTYGAKLFAMIGRPPETIFDRSIIVSMKRKSVNEKKATVKSKKKSILHLSREVKQWCETNSDTFDAMRVAPLDVNNDRCRDNYEPLLRIAACISDTIEKEARESSIATALLQQATDDSGEQLISDIRHIFYESQLTAISTAELVAKLRSAEGGVWSSSNGNKAIGSIRLAQMLALFEISPKQVRINGKQIRGYSLESFEDSFSRYCTEGAATKK
jgi:hypothetical protein